MEQKKDNKTLVIFTIIFILVSVAGAFVSYTYMKEWNKAKDLNKELCTLNENLIDLTNSYADLVNKLQDREKFEHLTPLNCKELLQ